jgi:hypothetical protein
MPYRAGEGSVSLPGGTAEAVGQRDGKCEFSAFLTAVVEREMRGQILDEYLFDYESRKGPISRQERERARQVFDEVFAEEDKRPVDS